MTQTHLWLGLEKIIVTSDPPELSKSIIKVCNIDDHVFALTKDNSLLHGVVDRSSDLNFTKLNISAIDIACNTSTLYFVSDNGQVFRTYPDSLKNLEEIILKEDAKCCVHGYKTPGHRIRARAVAAGDCLCLYVTEQGQLWASGEQPQLGIQSAEPKKVTFFEKRCVISVACGSDFSLALVYKPILCTSEKDDSDSENEDDESEVFVSTCPLCVNESVSSPTSQQSMSDTCPLGLHVRQPNEDHYSSSTASKDNTADDKKSTDDSTSISVEEKHHPKEEKSNKCVDSTNASGDECKMTKTSVQDSEKIGDNDHRNSNNKGVVETEEESETDSLKEEKKNEFFINTDAARQFLTRQLSWVSSYGGAGEELLVECAEASLVRPTRILKQNVSNMASLVYEGVKTVGDRVATLSRHMSGGSETSETVPGGLAECESFEELSNEELKPTAASVASSLRCEDFPWSSSAGTSERGDGSDLGIAERITAMVRRGTGLLTSELWSWGNVQFGQLGIGDMGKRSRPTLVSHLLGTGVRKIACGRFHALAVTLDGRAFAWGRNNANQVTFDSTVDQSSPYQVSCLPNSERAKDVAAGEHHSLLLTHDCNVFYIGRVGTVCEKNIVKLNVPYLVEETNTQKQIFSSKQIGGCLVTTQPTSTAVQDLTVEQIFLEEAIFVQNSLIKPVQKKGAVTQETNVYETLCVCYGELLSFTALNVVGFWDYVEHGRDASSVTIINHVDEHIKVYRNYLNAACDVISLSGFAHIARLVDIPQKLFNIFSERVQIKKNKKSPEAIVTCALLQPLNRLSIYKCMIQSLMRSNAVKEQSIDTKQVTEKKLQDALGKWDQLWEEQERRKKEADMTRQFWESSGRLVELLRSPERRLVRESRSHPISVLNSGRFSSHWFVLLTDVLVHVIGGSQTVHPVTTVWVEPLQDTDALQNAILLTVPEDMLTVYTQTPQDKTEWLQALQNTIKKGLQKSYGHTPPAARSASYSFTKHPVYKDAKYTGRWFNGKLQGPGKLEWSDGRIYVGHFQNNFPHGFGHMDTPGVSVYEGQWKDGQQNGYGVIKYACGDVYEGYFKDGQAHGHGVRKQGHFMASVASVYIGEWVAGCKQGYGVMNDIVTGDKYLGCWSNNMKHGCGLIVTVDGIYYEGVFMQDVLTGHGVMVFEDGTHYEGEFRASGIFNGKGTLTFNSGDKIEGCLYGAWNEGVKITGTFHKNMTSPPPQFPTKPNSFGKLCVSAHQKWKAIFRQCYQQLGLSEQALKSNLSSNKMAVDVQKVWENVAVMINSSHQETLQRPKGIRPKDSSCVDTLETIPQFGRESLDREAYQELRKYLVRAFESPHHPLGILLADITTAYTATYGGVRVHPLLLNHAVAELHSITGRIYEVVCLLFPALPTLGQEQLLGDGQSELESDVVSAAALLHPVLLPRVHSALFVLYAMNNKQEDDAYWKRLLKWNKQPDTTLMAFLGIDQKFWITCSPLNHTSTNNEQFSLTSPKRGQHFRDAVETLQQLKTTFSPLEKLLVIRSTFEQMTRAVQQELGTSYLWTMDDLFPVFHFVVVRSSILQLGSEIHFIEDFMEPYLQNGELGIMFTTLKACYYQILQEKISMSS